MIDTPADTRPDVDELRKQAINALYAGKCVLCRKSIAKGQSIVLHAHPRRYAHLDCEEAGLEEPHEPSLEELLEQACEALREIVRLTRAGNPADPAQLVAEVHEMALQASQRARGRCG